MRDEKITSAVKREQTEVRSISICDQSNKERQRDVIISELMDHSIAQEHTGQG